MKNISIDSVILIYKYLNKFGEHNPNLRLANKFYNQVYNIYLEIYTKWLL